mgnify:FL=1
MKKLLILLLISHVLVHAQGEQLYADGTATDQDGNSFEWINYGTQDWAIQNADVVTYSDGTPIPQVTDANEWENLTTGAWSYYNNDPTKPRLYNWYAVAGIHDNDPNIANKEFAPEGWHVPSDAEWTTLENYLIANGYNYDGITSENKIGKAMASTTGWNTSTYTGAIGNDQSTNNSSGFYAFPEGFRYNNGSFVDESVSAIFWSSTEVIADDAWYRSLYNNNSFLYRNGINKRYGFSVRFVRDAQTASTKDYSKPVAIYPNPTSSIVTIEDGAAYDIEVYSLQGRKLMTQKGNSIDLSALSNAIYLIKAPNTANMQEQIYKVIKE